MSTSLKKTLAIWAKSKYKDDANYARASKSFNIVLDGLLSIRGQITPAHADCLYRIMRYEGKHSVTKKIEYIGKYLGKKTLAALHLHEGQTYGLIGGTLGSTRDHLGTAKKATRLVKFLGAVRAAQSVSAADALVREYLKNPLPGLGHSVISSYLYAIRPNDYPIVNDGVADGLAKVLVGFSKTNDVRGYLDNHVMRFRVVRQKLGLKNFGQFDGYFGFMKYGFKGTVKTGDKFSPLDDKEVAAANSSDAMDEGFKKTVTHEISIRNPKARFLALTRGYNCQVCGFNFEKFYGTLGAGFAEVHHIKPLSGFKIFKTVPEKDLIVLCSNCHRMLHRSKKEVLPWKTLQRIIQQKK
jgi:hypothetical protein